MKIERGMDSVRSEAYRHTKDLIEKLADEIVRDSELSSTHPNLIASEVLAGIREAANKIEENRNIQLYIRAKRESKND